MVQYVYYGVSIVLSISNRYNLHRGVYTLHNVMISHLIYAQNEVIQSGDGTIV
jgi:hypothetical protein